MTHFRFGLGASRSGFMSYDSEVTGSRLACFPAQGGRQQGINTMPSKTFVRQASAGSEKLPQRLLRASDATPPPNTENSVNPRPACPWHVAPPTRDFLECCK